MDEISGVIFPVPEKFVARLLHEKRDVFVKYIGRSTNLRITPRNKVIFYASQGSKKLVGEGIIQEAEFLTPSGVLEKYKDRVFLDREELMRYATQDPKRALTKKLLVLVLKRVKAYSPHLKWVKPITINGQYITEEEYRELQKKGRLPCTLSFAEARLSGACFEGHRNGKGD